MNKWAKSICALGLSVCCMQNIVYANQLSASYRPSYAKALRQSVADLDATLKELYIGVSTAERQGATSSELNGVKHEFNVLLNNIMTQDKVDLSDKSSVLTSDLSVIGTDIRILSTDYGSTDNSLQSDSQTLLNDIKRFGVHVTAANKQLKQHGYHSIGLINMTPFQYKVSHITDPNLKFSYAEKQYINQLNKEESGWYIEIDGVDGEKYSGSLDVTEYNNPSSHSISGTIDGTDQAIIPISGNPQMISVVVQDMAADGGISVSIYDTQSNLINSSQTNSNYGEASTTYSGN